MPCARASAPRPRRSRPPPARKRARRRRAPRGRRHADGRHAEPDSAALEGTVAFTGRLASMKRADAFALVRKHGGKPREGVTRQTDVLIVGQLGWPLLDDGRPSNSLAQAKSYGIPIASERQFLDWIGRSAPEEQAKTYTADQLASLEQAAERGRRPARHVRPDRSRATASTASAISRPRARSPACSAPGPALSVITRSLHEIRKWLPDARPLQPAPVPGILRPDPGRADEGPHRPDRPIRARRRHSRTTTPTRSSSRRRRPRRQDDLATAERLYRRVMKIDPRRSGRAVQSRQRAACDGTHGRSGDRLPRRRQGRPELRAGLVQSRRCARRSGPHQGRDRLP